MAIETMWLQNLEYSARQDRRVLELAFGSRQRVADGLVVSQTGGGDFTVTISAGTAVVIGDDTADQGVYVVYSTTDEVVAVPASPGVGSRTDLVVLQVNDPQAGGGAGDDSTLEVLSGVDVASVPASAVPLAEIARTSAEGAILTAAITDVRPYGQYPYTVSDSAPVDGVGVPKDIWIQVV